MPRSFVYRASMSTALHAPEIKVAVVGGQVRTPSDAVGRKFGTLCESGTAIIPLHRAEFTDFLHIGCRFTIKFRNAKEQPSLPMLHSPSLRLTIHIPSRSEVTECVSRLPLRCPVLACVTMP